jgi:hypothetical protein
MDYREKYKKRVEEEEKQGKISREKRIQKKNLKDSQLAKTLEFLKEHCTGLITWKQKKNSYIWDGYVGKQKVFKISQGIYKFSLSVYPDVEVKDKKDKSIKTSFDLNKLELVAELIAKGLTNKVGKEST